MCVCVCMYIYIYTSVPNLDNWWTHSSGGRTPRGRSLCTNSSSSSSSTTTTTTNTTNNNDNSYSNINKYNDNNTNTTNNNTNNNTSNNNTNHTNTTMMPQMMSMTPSMTMPNAMACGLRQRGCKTALFISYFFKPNTQFLFTSFVSYLFV